MLIVSQATIANTYSRHNGELRAQLHRYDQQGIYPEQDYTSNQSLAFQSSSLWQWNQGRDRLSFVPYLRIDQYDQSGTYADIRELIWTRTSDHWEISAGIGRIFWGVTEFNHLVDIVNQTDLVADIDGEAKLGQPMINLSLIRPWGNMDLLLLPGFRQRTFPSVEGRLRTPVPVDTNNVQYQSAQGYRHTDFAVRWSHVLGSADLGIYLFRGTSRDPVLLMSSANLTQGHNLRASPYYPQITQIGVDTQFTRGNWLYKWEARWRRHGKDQDFAAQLGVEYAAYNLPKGGDLAIFFEYGWDEQREHAVSGIQDDLFLGARWLFNNTQSGELIAAINYDLDYKTRGAVFEFSQRAFKSSKFSLQARVFNTDDPRDVLQGLAADDHIKMTLTLFF